MANKKFSDFTSKTSPSDVSFVVGYDGSDNVRISPSNLLGAYLPLAGGTMSGNTIHGDNVKSLYGTGSDLEIYHDGTDSFIENETGHFYIRNNSDDKDIIFQTDDGSGGVDTYFQILGQYNRMQFNKNIRSIDNAKITFGSDDDLQILHDGSDSLITNNTGHLYITNLSDDKDIYFRTDDGSGGVATYLTVGGANEVTSFQKATKHEDNVKAYFGNASDLSIYHNGANSYIEDTGTGDFYLQTNGANIFLRNGTTGNSFISMNTGNDDVSLKYGGSEKLATTSAGVSITGNANFADNGKAIFGAGSDLEIYHSGSHSFISEQGTGSLITLATDYQLNNSANSQNMITATDGGAVTLFTAGVAKLATTSAGVSVTGSISITGDGSNATTLTESGSGDFDISTVDDLRLTSGGNDIVLRGASAAEFGRLSNDSNNLVIKNTTADKDIIFQTDDGSGGETAYLTLDGSTTHSYFSAGNVGIGTTSPTAKLQVVGLAEHADNSAATTAGLTAGAFYRTGDLLKVVH